VEQKRVINGSVMKRVVFPFAVVCLLAAVAYAGDTVIEEIVVRINGSIISRSDLQRSKEDVMRECKEKGGSDADCQAEMATREKDVLRDLIDQQLLQQKAADLGITGDTELIKRLDEMRKQMHLESMEALEKAAEQQGVSFEDYKQNIRNQIITQAVIQREVGPKISITPEDVKQFYDSHQKELDRPEAVQLSEILLSTASKPAKEGEAPEEDAASIAAAQKKADAAAAAIKKSEKFEDVAKKYSDGPTAAQGGDLGDFKRGTLAKQLEDRVFSMKKDEVTEPIRTKQGFVILKVTEHQAAGVPPRKDVESEIQNAIYYQKLQPALRDYMTKLREEAFIDIKPGFVDTGASPNQTKPVVTTAAEDSAAREKLKKKKRFLVF
jgi:peptidyl-prolyl cis-trans isomerase SurA